jgi:hypothetical protein
VDLAVAATWLVVVGLDDVCILDPVHDVGGSSEAGDDAVGRRVVPNDGSAIVEVVFEDLEVRELCFSWLCVVGVESPLLDVGGLLDLVLLGLRDGGLVARVVDRVSLVLDV